MLRLEGVATALIAWFAFRENSDGRIFVGLVANVAEATGCGETVSFTGSRSAIQSYWLQGGGGTHLAAGSGPAAATFGQRHAGRN
jgi:hypothetical protein